MHQTNMMALAISIHAPPRGATDPRYTTITRTDDFNSRPSARGDLHRKGCCDFDGLFQFTPLREGRHLDWAYKSIKELISIHAPPRGATLAALPTTFVTSISIHAPPRGATSSYICICGRKYFNSRPSARGDTQAIGGKLLQVQFQFTPLREGRHMGREKICFTG